MDRKLIFSQTYSTLFFLFFFQSDPTIVASSEGLIIQRSHCAERCFPSPGSAREMAFAWHVSTPSVVGWSFHCHQIGLSHRIAIMHYYSLAQINMNTQTHSAPASSLNRLWFPVFILHWDLSSWVKQLWRKKVGIMGKWVQFSIDFTYNCAA